MKRTGLAIGVGALALIAVALVLRLPAGPGPDVVVAALGQGQAAPRQAAPPAPAHQIERGRAVYAEQKCQACHSIAGVGNRRYPLDGVGSKLSVDDIRKWIVAPREMNPRVSKRAFDKLPAADLDALVAYISSLQKN